MQRLIVNGQEVDLEAIKKAQGAKTKERHETFQGDGLEISDLYADISIQPAKTEAITVAVTGPEDIVDRLTIKKEAGTVSIFGDQSNNVTMITQGNNISFGGSTTIISGNDVIINTGEADAKLSLQITAPIYTEVNLFGTTGKAEIGNLQGDIELDLSGKNFVRIASVRHLELDASGKCTVVVEEITGSAELDLSGAGKVQLRRGYVDNLSVDASGMCSVDAQITAKRADLDASGMSTIRAKEVTGRCRKRSCGMSSVSVG